jgi:hypothetical protein
MRQIFQIGELVEQGVSQHKLQQIGSLLIQDAHSPKDGSSSTHKGTHIILAMPSLTWQAILG